jgi:hypothetical protein
MCEIPANEFTQTSLAVPGAKFYLRQGPQSGSRDPPDSSGEHDAAGPFQRDQLSSSTMPALFNDLPESVGMHLVVRDGAVRDYDGGRIGLVIERVRSVWATIDDHGMR